MKTKIILSAFMFSLGLVACKDATNQEIQISENSETIPSSVRKSIAESFSGATEVNYSVIEKNKIYSSEFNRNEENFEAKLDFNGKILEVYSFSSSTTLPEVVTNYITKNFEGYKIVTSSLGKYNDKEAYKINLKNDKETVTIILNTNGELLSEFRSLKIESKYYPLKETELLPAIVTYLKEKSISFVGGVAVVDLNNAKTFSISGKKGNEIFALSFDSNGALLKSTSYTIPKAPQYIKSKDELPSEVLNAIKEYVFEKGFVLEDKNGVKTYNLILSKNKAIVEMLIDASGKIIKTSEKKVPVISSEEISTEALPEVIKQYLNEKFAGWVLQKANTTVVNNEKIDYKLLIKVGNDAYNVYFNGKGVFIISSKVYVAPSIKELNKTTIPAGILAYLNKNHAGWSFEKGSITSQNSEITEYMVVVKTDNALWYLYFDGKEVYKTGKKVELYVAPVTLKSKEDINLVIVAYLDKNYPGWSFTQGTQSSMETLIYFKLNNLLHVGFFNKNNEFVKILKPSSGGLTTKELKKESLPKSTIEYLDKNHQGWVLNRGSISFFNNDIIGYEMNITAGDKKWMMTFDEKGNVKVIVRL